MLCGLGIRGRINVEVGEDRKTPFRIGQNYSFMFAEMTANTFLIHRGEMSPSLELSLDLETDSEEPFCSLLPQDPAESSFDEVELPFEGGTQVLREGPMFCDSGNEDRYHIEGGL